MRIFGRVQIGYMVLYVFIRRLFIQIVNLIFKTMNVSTAFYSYDDMLVMAIVAVILLAVILRADCIQIVK